MTSIVLTHAYGNVIMIKIKPSPCDTDNNLSKLYCRQTASIYKYILNSIFQRKCKVYLLNLVDLFLKGL